MIERTNSREVNISASNFMKQVYYFYQCYEDNMIYKHFKDWTFNGCGTIDKVIFEFTEDTVYFSIYEAFDQPEVIVSCDDGNPFKVFTAIINALNDYYYLEPYDA